MPTILSSPAPPPTSLSAEVKNILDAPPVWLVRWGSLLLLGSILLLLVATGFVHYPRVITGQVTLRVGPQSTAVRLPPGATGYTLHVRPGQAVEAGQLLAIVQRGAGEWPLTAPTAGTVAAPARPGEKALLHVQTTARAQRPTVMLAARLSRQVQVGQRVLISLNAFPVDKFGQLMGRVVQAPQLAGAGQVAVPIALDQGYRSTHGILLPVTGTSQGTAQLIATDKRVLDRLVRL